MADAIITVTSMGLQGSSLRLPSVAVCVTPPGGQPPVETQLSLRPLVVGSSPDCDLVVADERVSRRHCELRLTDQGVLLRDLGSKNGTFVAQVQLREALLPPSVAVTLGSSQLMIRAAGTSRLVPISAAGRFGKAVGQSLLMRALFAKLERAAPTEHTVLLLGESGTGKEVLARAVHDHSPRKDQPFVVFDCSSVAPSLVEAELFGYAKGAFTGAQQPRMGLLEEASQGTLFLDEIGELPIDLQPKLLRALEARQIRRLGTSEWRPFNARIIAATHRNLRTQIAKSAFREDLYYRLAVVEVQVPALRERKEDIPPLIENFLAAYEPPRALSDVPPNALARLAAHDWPGNVRELRNVIARLLLFPDRIEEMLGPLTTSPTSAALRIEQEPRAEKEVRQSALLELPVLQARKMVVELFERSYVTLKLKEHKGNISRAAEAMGVSRQLLHRLVERYDLKTKESLRPVASSKAPAGPEE